MKRRTAFLTFLISFLLYPVFSHAGYIQDNYVGADDHGYGDVISSASSYDFFNIVGMNVDIVGNQMNVDILTNYDETDSRALGTKFGDLFISVDGWTPYGDSPYDEDDASNGTTWEFAFDVSQGKLYDISAHQDRIILSYAGGTFRNGQEVEIDPTDLTATGNGGSAGRSDAYYAMSFDIAGLDWELTDLAFHWGMTCANDVIEGVPTPEPATMILFGSGLIGLAGYGRKKLLHRK
jgi:hypothetical protein